MKMTRLPFIKLARQLVLALSLTLWLGACGKEETHSHDDGDHVHEDASTSHTAPSAGALESATESAEKALAAAKAEYPLNVCIVSGEELGSMGDPISYEHEGVTMKLCCEHCLPKIKKDPAKYVAKLTAALAGAAE